MDQVHQLRVQTLVEALEAAMATAPQDDIVDRAIRTGIRTVAAKVAERLGPDNGGQCVRAFIWYPGKR